jgi:hypothetical protein
LSEQDLTRAVIEAINGTRRAHVWRHQSGRVKVRGGWMHLAPPGSPDVVGYMLDGGRFLGIEVKLPGEQPTAIQNTWREQIVAAGGIAVTAWSVADAIAAVSA